MPLELYADIFEVDVPEPTPAIATNDVPPYTTEVHVVLDGNVDAVHVNPSVQIATAFELLDKATNVPLPYVTDCHDKDKGNVDAVHDVPLLLYIAEFPNFGRATKILFPYADVTQAGEFAIGER